MRFSTLICLAGLGAHFALAVPAPSPDVTLAHGANTTSIEDCKKAGVDPYGPIPTDYDSNDNGKYFFSPGSKASLWARAQVDLEGTPHAKRQGSGPANIGIGCWAQDWCTGQGVWVDDVNYNVDYYTTFYCYSVGISYRGLRSNEQLDFSVLSGSNWCGTYIYSAAPYTPVGCWNSQALTCWRLWLTSP